jgi:hypothetical protein
MDNVLSDLRDTAEAALDLLSHAALSIEGHQRLLDQLAANHQEARGHAETERLIALRIFDEVKATVRLSVEAFRDAVQPSRAAEAQAPLQQFVREAIAALEAAQFDGLGQKLTAFSYTRNRLSQPVPPPSPEDEARRVLFAGWNSLESGFLNSELREGDTPLKSFDAHQAITKTGRVISRKDLRDMCRPASWTRVDTWYAQFAEIPKEEQ